MIGEPPLTHERELTEAVDLCTADGRHLSPAARGWSRVPLHSANLRGGWGRTKRWDYWAILAGDLVVSFVYADVDYVGLSDVWWVDLESGRTGGRSVVVPGAAGMSLPDIPGSSPLGISRRKFALSIVDDEDGNTRAAARWTERDGSAGELEAVIETPVGHESLNVVIPWSNERFQFTSKHQARPARGRLVVGGREWSFGATQSSEAWGVLDVGRGRWPYRTVWNWAGGAGHASSAAGDRVVGLQFGGKWTEGTGFTENGVIVDGTMTKIGSELEWTYRWDEPMDPWRVRGSGVDLVLTPRYDKATRLNAGLLSTETHQVFGTWAGEVVTADGETVSIAAMQGFAEESRSRW